MYYLFSWSQFSVLFFIQELEVPIIICDALSSPVSMNGIWVVGQAFLIWEQLVLEDAFQDFLSSVLLAS